MKKFFILSLFFFIPYFQQAQTSLDEINKTRTTHTLNGMIAFSAWTGVNLVAGTAGVLSTTGELQHFFEMNIYFNVINLGIAVPGIISAVRAKHKGLSFEQTVKEAQKVNTVFLVNGVLDFTYITAGFLLREIGKNNSHNPSLRNRLVGYGNSFIVQGGFLLLFDFIKFGLHSANSKRIDEHWKRFSVHSVGAYGLGMSLSYNLQHSKKKPYPSIFK